MAPEIPVAFEREQGYTDSEWQRCLPGAVGVHALALPAPGQALVRLHDGAGGGQLQISWSVLPPRRIALLNLPRLAVHYRFDGVAAPARREFMRYFDLYTQRGGG
ncbi:MAG: hypothetical protein Q8K45_01680 [Rubrivivax sp.]|nr:hypothetical protein [Rubrivivax sp.]